MNESPIIEAGFLQPLINLLAFKDNEEVQCHAISTLRNLAASSEKNKWAIVKAGAVQSIKELVLEVPMNVQSEMTACVAVLALSDELKGQLLEMGICEVLIPLTNSPSSEVQVTARPLWETSRQRTDGRPLMIIPLLTRSGTSPRVECIIICTAS